MADEVKIEQEQFDQLVRLLEDVGGYSDQVASYLSVVINEKLDDLIHAVKAVETAVEALPHD